MDLDTFLYLNGIAMAASWTPGPNTVMLASSGASFGWRRTLPHTLGITFGFPAMVLAVALGIGQVFQLVPWLQTAMLWTGFAVMMWLAWRIGTARPSGGEAGPGRARPLSFFEGAAFQWINPKAWAITLGVSGAFVTAERPVTDALMVAAAFFLAAVTSTQGWAIFGTAMGRFLGQGQRLRIFNAVMGLLLAGCAVWTVL